MAVGIDIPENGWYVLANTRVPVSLAPALAGGEESDGLAAADIAVAASGEGRRQRHGNPRAGEHVPAVLRDRDGSHRHRSCFSALSCQPRSIR